MNKNNNKLNVKLIKHVLLQLDDNNIEITKQDEMVARTTALNSIANRMTELENCESEHKEDLDQFKQDLAEHAKKVKEELVKLTDLANAHSKINDSIVWSMQALERDYYSTKQLFSKVSSMYTFSCLPYIAFALKTYI